MLPQHLMSLHEISKREERTMALCVKKLNRTCLWDEETATTAASPSTSTPPSVKRVFHDDTVSSIKISGLLRRLWREFYIVDDYHEYIKAGKCQYPTTAIQFCSGVGLFLECDNARLLSASDLSNRRRHGNLCFGDRFRYGLRSKASIQQRWMQLRKYWRHNARRRLRKTERDQHVQQFSAIGRTAEEISTNVSPSKSFLKFPSSFNIDNYNDNIFHVVCRNSSQDSQELLRRHFWFLKFRYSNSFQHIYQQQYHLDQYLQQIELRTLQEWYSSFGQQQQQQLSTRTIFQHPNETTQGQSNIVNAKSSKISTRSNHTHNASNLFHLIAALLCGQLSVKLYTNSTCRHSRRRTICDSMSPIFLARSKKRLPTKTSARMSERTRPSVRLCQSIALVSHPRNRYVSHNLVFFYLFLSQ